MSIIETAYKEAIKTIEKCATSNGIYASGGPQGYNSVWSRDSMICLLGAALAKGKFKPALAKTIETLSINQSAKGQIPNCVDLFDKKRKKQVTFATMDSSLWYIIGNYFYAKAYKDDSLLKKYKNNIEKTFIWVSYQDSGEELLPEQQPTCDWEDCFPHKYGHVLNSQALYYGALKMDGQNELAKKVKTLLNGGGRLDLKMFDSERGYYLPWIWKDHDGIREQEGWFDSSGNLLAILFGLADKEKANSILNYIEKNKLNKPYPVRAIYPPIEEGTPEWKDYFSKCLAGEPNKYINGGIWPYIGGFYVAALVAAGKHKRAEEELESLAEANSLGKENQWDFNEWVDPISGEASGSEYHAWSAGAYLFAYQAVKEKKVPVLGNL